MSFRIALTGLSAANSDLNVTADNIANVNTNGFKGSRAEFADIVASGGAGAVASNVIGDGVQTVAITQQFGQGNISFTGNALDLAINGNGFFRLNDNGSVLYGRAGSFGTDRDGFVVNSLGQRLTGFGATATGTITGAVTDLQVSTADVTPQASTSIVLGANLDASGTVPGVFDPADHTNPSNFNHSTSVTVYDSLGNGLPATMYFRKTATTNRWETWLDVNGTLVSGAAPNIVDFTPTGVVSAGGTIAVPGFNPGTGAANLTLTLDYTSLTQYGSQFGVSSLSQDGFSSGRLTGLSVEENGIMFGRYSNGQSLALGQVILADFANAQGLQRVGDNAWAESFSSGSPLVGPPGSSTLGLVQSGALEDSNVELTEELVNLINAQRNYQANAQVISAADTLTQTILNIG